LGAGLDLAKGYGMEAHVSALGPAFDAAQQRWDGMTEDDVYGADEAEELAYAHDAESTPQDFEFARAQRRISVNRLGLRGPR
jgi:hypothetical protein